MNTRITSAIFSFLTLLSLGSAESQPQRTTQHLPTGHVYEAVLNGDAKLLGTLPGSQKLQFDVTLSLGQPDELQQFLEAVYDKSSSQFRHFVTPEQFTERFGPTQADADQVVAFAQKHGFRLLGGSRHQMNLQFEASVASIEEAFHVSLNTYQHPVENRTFFSPDREPTTDEPLAIWHISGLDDFSIPHPASLHPAGKVGQSATGITYNGFYLSSTWRTAYYGGSLTGAGQSVGLLELTPYNPADVASTFYGPGQPIPRNVNPISVGGNPTTCTTNCSLAQEQEPILDIVQVASMAPGLSAINVYVGGSASNVLAVMSVHSPLDKQISSSWTFANASSSAYDLYFWRFAAQGQSYFNSAGDHGNYADYDYYYAEFASSEVYPADSAWVTSVGGTTIYANSTGAWRSESAWNVLCADDVSGVASTFDCWGGGGGYSPNGIGIPPYQTYSAGIINTANNGSPTLRNVPDVSANAAQGTYICASIGGGANTPAHTPAGSQYCEGWGGTSAAAPIWAGYLALVNQQAALNSGGPIGFINPYIYALAAQGGNSYTSAFHDIADESSNGQGFNAVAGYDLVTGWGSPNGTGLLNALVNESVQLIANPLGVTPAGNPYAFVKGNDGGLWVNFYAAGSTWPWEKLGAPSGAAIASAVGVTETSNADPYVFVTGDDGNLWLNSASGSAWPWTNLGRPSSTGIVARIGVGTTNSGADPFALITGTDGNLWDAYWNGSAWKWLNIGKPGSAGIAGAVGVGTDSSAYPYAIVTGTDGNLWDAYWNGSAWEWLNLGKPSGAGIASAVGVGTTSVAYPYALVIGTDGNLWDAYWNGSAWKWLNIGKPSSAGIAGSVGVGTINVAYPYGIIIGTDGNLWDAYWNGTGWYWGNLGKPGGAGIARAVGVTTAAGSYPYIYVIGTDGTLWLDFLSNSGWMWTNQGAP